VDLKGRMLHVINRRDEGELTKSRKNRSVPMYPDVHNALASLWRRAPKVVAGGHQCPKYPHAFVWPDRRRFKPGRVSGKFAKLVQEARIAPATVVLDTGPESRVDKYTVKDLGGWSTVGVVEKHYTEDYSDVLKAAMNQIVPAG
jgi:integrase